MSLGSPKKLFFDSPVPRLIAVNVVVVVVMALGLFLVIRTFDQVSILFDRDVSNNLKIALKSFDLDKELMQVSAVVHDKEDILLHDPEGMLVGRQEVLSLFDDVLRKIKLTDNYFNSADIYQMLLGYRHSVEQRMNDDVEISAAVLQLDLLNQFFLKTLNEMEVATGTIIVENVLAGFEVTGLHQINALLPFCREQILEAGSLMDRAVVDLAPQRIAAGDNAGEQRTLTGIIQSLARTLETLTSAHPVIAQKADSILVEIDSYQDLVHQLEGILAGKLLHRGEFELKQKELSQRQSLANKEMVASLLRIGKTTQGEMANAMKSLTILALIVLIVSMVGVFIASLIGRQMQKGVEKKEHARLVLETKMVQLVHEMSLRERAEENVRELNKKLEQSVNERTMELNLANKELQALVYSLSHDLRTPLRGIAGFSHVLLAEHVDAFDETALEYLGRIEEGSLKMGRTIDAILELSRLTREEIHKEEVNLSAIAEAVVEELRRNNPERLVQVDISSGLLALASSQQIKAMLENLLGNAWKFTSKKKGARIAFGVEKQNGTSVYYVRDNGVGFNMEYSDKMFGAFQRLHSLEEYPGVGVGLALVQRVARKHGGKVWAESSEGEGATFYFTLG